MVRTTYSVSPAELKAIKELENIRPEWRFLSTSEKVRALFWLGYQKLKEEQEMQVQKGALLYAFVNSESYMAQD